MGPGREERQILGWVQDTSTWAWEKEEESAKEQEDTLSKDSPKNQMKKMFQQEGMISCIKDWSLKYSKTIYKCNHILLTPFKIN